MLKLIMSRLNKEQFNRSRDYIYKNARRLDVELFKVYFESGSAEKLMEELLKYQNEDGGFGNGLEPDVQMKASSPLATTIAFQYMNRLSGVTKSDVIDNALQYLDSIFVSDNLQWYPVTDEANSSPHAPWWEFSKGKYDNDENWGNPTIEILGYFIKYKDLKESYKVAFEKAKSRILTVQEIETHELQCYKRMVDVLPDTMAIDIIPSLRKHIKKVVETNPDEWKGYVTKPLTFVDTPNSPYINLFKDSVYKELEIMVDSINEDGGWLPTWNWGGSYPDAWQKAKLQWSGILTVSNLIILKQFDLIELK